MRRREGGYVPSVKLAEAARDVLALYPRIFFACHERHVRDPRTRRLVSEHQVSILQHLDEATPTSLKDLAAHMGVTAGTMSIAVSRLIAAGYVRRRRDPHDTRRVMIRLSASGARVREAQSVLSPGRVEAMLGRLSAEELPRAISGLRLLAEAATRLAAEHAPNAGLKSAK